MGLHPTQGGGVKLITPSYCMPQTYKSALTRPVKGHLTQTSHTLYIVPLYLQAQLLYSVLSMRCEEDVSLLLAPAGADKRGPKDP